MGTIKAQIKTRQGVFDKEYQLISGRKVLCAWTSKNLLARFLQENEHIRLQSGEYEK